MLPFSQPFYNQWNKVFHQIGSTTNPSPPLLCWILKVVLCCVNSLGHSVYYQAYPRLTKPIIIHPLAYVDLHIYLNIVLLSYDPDNYSLLVNVSISCERPIILCNKAKSGNAEALCNEDSPNTPVLGQQRIPGTHRLVACSLFSPHLQWPYKHMQINERCVLAVECIVQRC